LTLVLADLLASPKTFSATGPRTGDNRLIHQQLAEILRDDGDFEYPSGYTSANEVQSIAAFGGSPSGGTFTLTVTLRSGQSFTTAGIAYNANNTTIQTAIDVAATAAAVPGWVNGHIVVTGGPLSTDAITITFSGASVSGQNQGQTTINATGVTGGTAGAATTSVDGQTTRKAWATLNVLGIVTSAPPAQGADPTGIVTCARGHHPHGLSVTTVKALLTEAAIEDLNNNVYTLLAAALGI
jgi:hypothetical protein